jgi:hypothetical protein
VSASSLPPAASACFNSRDARATVASGVDSSCAAPAASVVSETSRSLPRRPLSNRFQCFFPAAQRLRHAADEVRDELGGDCPSDPHREQMRGKVVQSMVCRNGLVDMPFAITNESPNPFIRTKTADEIFASISRYCQRISDSPH